MATTLPKPEAQRLSGVQRVGVKIVSKRERKQWKAKCYRIGRDQSNLVTALFIGSIANCRTMGNVIWRTSLSV